MRTALFFGALEGVEGSVSLGRTCGIETAMGGLRLSLVRGEKGLIRGRTRFFWGAFGMLNLTGEFSVTEGKLKGQL